jgi:hypothetical protein
VASELFKFGLDVLEARAKAQRESSPPTSQPPVQPPAVPQQPAQPTAKCPKCNGRKYEWICPVCNGSGTIVTNNPLAPYALCGQCGGTAKTECRQCDGTGRVAV